MIYFDRMRVEPMETALTDPGRELLVDIGIEELVPAYWWRHWSMPDGVWWSNSYGVVYPTGWYR